jgi:hypothetical protein
VATVVALVGSQLFFLLNDRSAPQLSYREGPGARDRNGTCVRLTKKFREPVVTGFEHMYGEQ